MDDQNIAIKVHGVSKFFSPSAGQQTIKQIITRQFKKDKKYTQSGYWAVKNANFEVKKGEFFGIVGRNGSGKSTLLKMMAGVYTPTKGAVSVNGKLVPFIELGVGFNAELSGRDNVFLNGALLGFSRQEMEAMYDEIVEFAELQDHMDVKLKNFSSGMQVRLAFSIAIRSKSEILIIDEVLAVGDEAFQRKCFDYFDSLKLENKTVVFISHDMSNIEKYCDRVLVIDGGKSDGVYKANIAAARYKDLNKLNEKKKKLNQLMSEQLSEKNIISSVLLVPEKETFTRGESVKIELRVNKNIAMDDKNEKITIIHDIYNSQGILFAELSNSFSCRFRKATCKIDSLNLPQDFYYIYTGIYTKNKSTLSKIDATTKPLVFNITGDSFNSNRPILDLKNEWLNE